MKLPADAPFGQPDSLLPQDPNFSADRLLDILPWGVLVLDTQRIVRRVNQQAAR